MLFHKIRAKSTISTMVAGAPQKGELKLRVIALIVWLVATIILVMLAIVAYCKGWPDGAKQILAIASAIVGSGGLGIIFGERSTAKEAGLTN